MERVRQQLVIVFLAAKLSPIIPRQAQLAATFLTVFIDKEEIVLNEIRGNVSCFRPRGTGGNSPLQLEHENRAY